MKMARQQHTVLKLLLILLCLKTLTKGQLIPGGGFGGGVSLGGGRIGGSIGGSLGGFGGRIGVGGGEGGGGVVSGGVAGGGGIRGGVSLAVSLENLLQEEWSAFKLTYNKQYRDREEEDFRREIFIENRHKIARFNQEYGSGRRTFVQQLNPYADQLHHEFNRNLNGFNRTVTVTRVAIPKPSTYIPSANVALPDHIDWRDVGAVSPVKSQGLCAGCWAFAAAGALEGHTFRKTGQVVELSPQNLIDCTQPYGNEGCTGGLVEPAFEYVRDNPGIDVESAYPYEAKDGQCRFRRDAVGAECTGYVGLAPGDEKGLEIAVATLGPVAVAIDASRDSLQFYSDGVYFDPECGNSAEEMNHAVLVVGYGREPDGRKYWMVKNSYGPQWGIGGYIKMAKDANNHCGIATQASYPLV